MLHVDKTTRCQLMDLLLQALILATFGLLRFRQDTTACPNIEFKYRLAESSFVSTIAEARLPIAVPWRDTYVTSANRIHALNARSAIFVRDGPPMSISTYANGTRALSFVVLILAEIENTFLSPFPTASLICTINLCIYIYILINIYDNKLILNKEHIFTLLYHAAPHKSFLYFRLYYYVCNI